MRNLACLIVPFVCAAAGPPPPVESVIDMARAAPGAFAADAMIRLAGLDSLEKARKVSLLEEAYRRAAESPEPFRRRAGITSGAGSSGFFNRAFDQDLDALTLRLRVVEALLSLDKSKARELFVAIPRVSLPKLKCSDLLVYDVTRYYKVLGRVALETYTDQQVDRGERQRLLLQHAGSISSPEQVSPMARVIVQAKATDDDLRALVAAYADALTKINGDDRSYTHAHSTGPAIFAVVEELKTRKLNPLQLLEAYRLYLVANLSAKRCADGPLMLNAPQSFGIAADIPTAITDEAGFFNLTMRIPPLLPIEDGEIQPDRMEGTAEGLRSCDDSDCKSLAAQYKDLVFHSNGLAYSPAERKSDDWQAKMGSFLNAMAFWQESSATPLDQYFRNKCGMYMDLLGMVPKPENQDTVARAMLSFVEPSRLRAANPIQWFLPVNALLGRAGLDPQGYGKLLEELQKSHDPLIALYAHLEALAPRGPQLVMPLL